ncbi:AraC family transcriptional regulator [Gracilibacillus sp. YIM 98692]|uniref:AraC family transcriptional regulator n=1 Tax=Gracilibacillus sp. YIM 98692 TaxID=2663532 RepID=UPI0013D11FDC|nr:AraC family transcriptional regulator [Gracilibacillus sp. YIM 98692]
MKIGFCGYAYHNQRMYTSHHSRYAAYLFRLQTDGTAKVVLNGKKREIEKGDLLIIKPGEQYELFVDDGQKSGDFHLYCEGEWIDKRFKHSPDFSKIEMDDTLLNLWHHLIIEERRPYKERNSELTHYLLQALCVSLERVLDSKKVNTNRPYVVTRMMRFIEQHATTPGFKVQDVADHCHLSVSRSVHLFKEHVGQTIIDYAQSIRISAAINQMKYTTMTLENIALNCGFGSYSYFHRVFKKQYSISPRAYRDKI